MMKIATIIAVLLTLFSVACVHMSSSGPLPFGKDSYIITVNTSLRDLALAEAVKEANSHCQSLGKLLVPRNTSSQDNAWSGVRSGQIIYSCVDETDPEYQRPHMEKEADTVIKVK